jgi:hypothetical protein
LGFLAFFFFGWWLDTRSARPGRLGPRGGVVAVELEDEVVEVDVLEVEVDELEVDVLDGDAGVVELDDDELEVELDDALLVVLELDDEVVVVVVPVLVVLVPLVVVELVDVLVVAVHDPAADVAVVVHASAIATGEVTPAIVPNAAPMSAKKSSNFALVRKKALPIRGQTVCNKPQVHTVTAFARE